jgi:hypothetical protein
MIEISAAKRVSTYNADGHPNGWLMELEKSGNLTLCYLTVAFPGCFKGYHLHTKRVSNYVCLRGSCTVILYTKEGRLAHEMKPGYKLHIDINIPTGIHNRSDEECWLINFPDPPYDPELTGEQVDFDQAGVEEWLQHG